MKVKLLKDHLQHKAGDVVEAHQDMANYWQSIGLAEKQEMKPVKEKNDHAGPTQKAKK